MTGMHTKSVEKKLTGVFDQSGTVAVIMAVVLVGLCGFMALAVDIGHMTVVKAELQKAADAGALSGAVNLTPYTSVYPHLTPNWLNGQTAAATIVNDFENKADNIKFSIASSDVLSGFWLLKPQGQSQTLPKSKPLATYMPAPAIRVTLTRSVTMLFAPIIGENAVQNVTATATAILPEAFGITGAFAMAVERSIVFLPSGAINTNYTTYGYGNGAQWYNRDGSNSVTVIRRNDQLQANDTIYIAPGAMDNLYSLIVAGQTIMVPVVNSVNEKTWQLIIAFVPFYVTGVSGKSIEGNFVDKCISPNANPTDTPGIYSGISGTPKLIGP